MKNLNHKYIVVADTSIFRFGIQITLFGIFNTYEEALNYVLKDETNFITINPYTDEQELFSFFEYYKDKSVSKEQYAHQFIRQFVDGYPINLGVYME